MICPVMQPILLSEGCRCNGLARLMSGRKPVDQAVGCSGEHVYRGAVVAL